MAKEEIPGRFLLMGLLRETFSPPVAFSFEATMALVEAVLLGVAVRDDIGRWELRIGS